MTLSQFSYTVTTAAWAPKGDTFVTGSQDTEFALCLWNLHGEREYTWKEDNLRIYDLSISPDGERLVVLLESRIMVYNFVTKEKLQQVAMGKVKLTSVNISKNSQCMLVSMNDNKIQLMDIDSGEVLQKFEGHLQVQYVIRSAFGGANETHVVSGSEGMAYSKQSTLIIFCLTNFLFFSEDSRIYIWRTTGQLVEALDAHRSKCVNAVAWHPQDPSVFASVGDDHRLRMCVARSLMMIEMALLTVCDRWSKAKNIEAIPHPAQNGHGL